MCYNNVTSEGLFFCAKKQAKAIFAYIVCASHYTAIYGIMPVYALLREANLLKSFKQKYFP